MAVSGKSHIFAPNYEYNVHESHSTPTEPDTRQPRPARHDQTRPRHALWRGNEGDGTTKEENNASHCPRRCSVVAYRIELATQVSALAKQDVEELLAHT